MRREISTRERPQSVEGASIEPPGLLTLLRTAIIQRKQRARLATYDGLLLNARRPVYCNSTKCHFAHHRYKLREIRRARDYIGGWE